VLCPSQLPLLIVRNVTYIFICIIYIDRGQLPDSIATYDAMTYDPISFGREYSIRNHNYGPITIYLGLSWQSAYNYKHFDVRNVRITLISS
jgi:hypothetical protein